MEKRVPKGRKMWTVQIDENGGVHIPKEALALIGLKAGESAVLTGDKRRGLVLVAESRAESVQEAFLKEEFSALIFYGNLRAGLACGGAVSGESEAAQEERGIGDIGKSRVNEDKAGLWNAAFVL